MKSIRILVGLVAALALVLAGLLLVSREGSHSDLAAGRGSPTVVGLPRPDAELLPDEVRQDELAGAGSVPGNAREAAPAALRSSSAGRALVVRVRMPEGAPSDPELSVLAMPPGLGDFEDERLRSGDIDFEPIRAVVGPDAVARLAWPAGWSAASLTLDGDFLFLKAPLQVEPGRGEVELDAQLGALLSVRWASPDGVEPTGSMSLTGGNFGGGGGWAVLDRENVTGGEVAFRALDPAKTWTLVPDFEDHHAYMQMGVELEPGQARTLTLEVLSGATLSGTVSDTRGTALEGVEVRMAGGSPWMRGADVRNATTDEHGAFTLKGLRPGDVTLEAELEGWRTATTEPLELEDGDRLADLTIVLDRGLSVAGSVRWPDGQPAALAEVWVEALRQRQGWGNWGASPVEKLGRVFTSDDGTFVISGLPEGSFTLRASRMDPDEDPGEAALWRAQAEAVPAGASGIELTLAAPIQFRGKVIDDAGNPLSAFFVRVESVQDGGPQEDQSYEQAEGKFVFSRVGPGEWRVRVSADHHVASERRVLSLPAGADAELVFELSRTATVRGRVVQVAGVGVPGAKVLVDGARGGNPWTGARGPSAESAGEGSFSLEDVEPGQVALIAQAENWADSEPVSFEALPGETVEDVQLVLRVGGRIEGGVVTPEGDPMAGQRVTWGANAMGFGSRDETRTDGSGRFVFEHVTPGEWSVSAAPSMAEMGERMRGREGDPSVFAEVMGGLLSETVALADGELAQVWLGGEPRMPVRIHGEVTLGGEALAGAQVYAVSEGSAVFEGMKTSIAGPDGRYELTVDRPGPYVLSAQSDRLGVETLVDVPREEELRVDLAVPQGRVEGRVTKPGGGPAAGVSLRIQRDDGLGRMRWQGDGASTDEDGRYAFVALEAGTYTVRANVSNWGSRANDSWGTVVRDGVSVSRDGTTRGVDFRLEQAGSVEGVIRGPTGAPQLDATVFFRAASGRLESRFSGIQTDSAGRFKKTGLAPGEYTISTRAEGYASLDDASVRVASGETTEVELSVSVATDLVVVVEDEDGRLRRARIEVFDDDDNEVGSAISLQALRAAFNEGASSLERRLGPFPEGRYTVRATTQDGTVTEKRVRLRGRDAEKSVTLKLD